MASLLKLKTHFMCKNGINLFLFFIIAIGMIACRGNQKTSSEAKDVNIVSSPNAITYNGIKSGSYLDWRAAHLGGTGPRLGKIYFKEASIIVNNGRVANVDVIIDMASLTVDNLEKDRAYDLSEHLKHEDFFNVKTFPTSRFELTKIEEISGSFNSNVTGNLMILGISKSITFKANINVSDNEVSVKSEDFVIDRSDWGLTYRAEGTKDVPLNYLISDEVGFTIDITILKSEL